MSKYKETKGLDQRLNAAEIETRCIQFWEDSKVYAYDNTASRENTFVVDTPPPTVSGSLHIGHILSYTQAEIMVRYQRMMGKSIFYPIGWDDNGLPTERRVQNYFNIACNPAVAYDPNFKPEHIEKDERPRQEVSRENFIEACEELIKIDEKAFSDIFHRIGHSFDWDITYSTIGKNARAVSQKSFLDLAEKGLVKSIEAPTMWDTDFGCAIAQAEIEDREMDSFFHDLKFKIKDSDEYLTIATTRPEFLPACIAVVANPEDERYKPYFGKTAIVPVFDIEVPILASEHAVMDKGTGILMVCTFGDADDVAWWKKSGLPIKQIVGLDGRIINQEYGVAPFTSLNPAKAKAAYDQMIGLKMPAARAKVVEMLRESNDLLAEPKPIRHPVKFYEKGSHPLEFVSSRQWFITLLAHKEELLEQGRKIKWTPAHMQSRYEAWVNGLNQDWCISRQRYFGVPFPVWYPVKENGEIDYEHPIFADKNTLPVDPMSDVPADYTAEQRGVAGGFVGDPDVMDTWATSSVTPQIAMATEKGADIQLPFDMRPQAHDIIRTWAFYTIAKAYFHDKEIPWKQALISGFVLDPDRKKMSKSKGNVVTPMHLLEKHSSDAVRYWAGRAKIGIDALFEEQVMEQGRKLTMKLFNASKFVFMILEKAGISEALPQENITNELDKSWLAQLKQTADMANKSFKEDDYAFALEMTEKCFWNFCDNYLEIVKGRAYEADKSALASLQLTLDTLLQLFAPFLAFTTEEVWQSRPWGESEKSIHIQHFPAPQNLTAASDVRLYEAVQKVVDLIRKAKAENQKSLKTPILDLSITAPKADIPLIQTAMPDIVNVSNIQGDAMKLNEGAEYALTACVFGENEPKPQA